MDGIVEVGRRIDGNVALKEEACAFYATHFVGVHHSLMWVSKTKGSASSGRTGMMMSYHRNDSRNELSYIY